MHNCRMNVPNGFRHVLLAHIEKTEWTNFQFNDHINNDCAQQFRRISYVCNKKLTIVERVLTFSDRSIKF